MRRPTKDPYARPAIATLERLHMELGGKLLVCRQDAQDLGEQMLHIEAVIKMLDPSFNLARITVKRRKANGWFKRGTLYRKALDVLRTAEQPLTATDIAWKMLEAADIKNASKTDAQVVAQGLLRSLISHNGKGIQNVAEGKPAKWRLAATCALFFCNSGLHCGRMPFTCTLPTFEPVIEGQTLTFGVGYDESASYSVVIGFSPLAKDGHAEFYFLLYRYSSISETELAIASGKLTKKLIDNSEHRRLIVEAVCEAILVLLEQVRPEWVFRCTNDPGLEGKSLRKHEAIAEAFKSCGYEEHPVSERAGCKAWWMWNVQDNS